MIGNLSKHKRNNDDTYKRSEIDLIVSNAKKSAVKYAEELAEKKLDKDENKGLSANDYTDEEKAEVAKVKDKVDKASGKGLSANDYTNAEKAEVAKVKDKVDKVSGKGLSTNDFTSAYKTKLDNLDTNLNNKVDKVTGKGLSKNDFTDDYKAKLDNLNTNISETLAGKADKTEVLTKTNTTAFTPTGDYQPATKKYVDDLASNKGGGDMMKSAYDANKDGVVNDSDKLGGQLPSYYAKASDLTNKVDKVSGKGLSTNDFTSAYKTKLDNLDTNLSGKVDKVSGKGLSANDFTDNYKAKLDNLDNNSGKKYSTVVIGNSANTTADKVDLLYTAGTDFAAILTQAVNSLPSSGGEVKILAGEYNITTTGDYVVSTPATDMPDYVKISGEGEGTVINYLKTTKFVLYCNYEFCNLKLVCGDSSGSSALISCTERLYVHECSLVEVRFAPPGASSAFCNNTISITNSSSYANGFLDYSSQELLASMTGVYVISNNIFTNYCGINFENNKVTTSKVILRDNYINGTIAIAYNPITDICYIVNNIISMLNYIPRVNCFCDNYILNSKFADCLSVDARYYSNNTWKDGIDQLKFANGETIGGQISSLQSLG